MDIQKTYVQMFQTLEAIERELAMIPNGWIESKGESGKCYRYYENSRKCSSTPDNIEELEKLFEKRKHLLQEKKILRVKMKSCREQLKKQGLSPTLIIRKYKREQKQKQDKMIRERQEQKKAFQKKHPENYIHKSDRGEWVASKSEMMIANTLFRWHIHYEYEQEIHLNGFTLKPDFTIIHNGKTYYWEHNGMMDKKKYRDAWHWRRDLYEANGIYEFVNMIITSETEKSPLTQEMIDKVIRTYFEEAS